MKFLFTMNMPSAQGYAVHQLTGEHSAASCDDLKFVLNNTDFVIVRQYYRKKAEDGSHYWDDRGDLIVNVQHIGKVQEFIERENHDEAYNNTRDGGVYVERTRKPLR